MGKNIRNTIKKVQSDLDAKLNMRFDYLSKEEKEKLLYGDDFIKVPDKELKRLRIDAYPYLM